MTMIKNEKQYQITNKQLENLKGALKTSETKTNNLPEILQKAMIDGIHSQIADLEQELNDYTHLKNPD